MATVTNGEEAAGPASMLDICFIMDCTGSMGSYINAAKRSVEQIVEEIVQTEQSDVHLALVQYRDHPPQDRSYVTRSHDFSPSARRMRALLQETRAGGGGDGPEAVADGMYQALKLNWRAQSTKICVLVADAPPHGLDPDGDGFPDGCPQGHDPMQLVCKMADLGAVLYVVGCEPSIWIYKDFFLALAQSTGGQYVPMTKSHLIANVIIGGAKEEMSLKEIQADLEREMTQLDADELNVEQMAEKLQEKLQTKETAQLFMNEQEIKTGSKEVVEQISSCSTLSEVRKIFKPRSRREYNERYHRRSRSPSYSDEELIHDARYDGKERGRGRGGRGGQGRRRSRERRRSRSRDKETERRSRSRSRSRSPENFEVVKTKLSRGQARRMVWRALKRKR